MLIAVEGWMARNGVKSISWVGVLRESRVLRESSPLAAR